MPDSSKSQAPGNGRRARLRSGWWLAILASMGFYFALFYFQVSYAGIAFWKNSDEPSQQVPNNVVVLPAPEQPIAFSHKQHVTALAFQCELCHVNPDPGINMGLPDADTCMACHVTVGKEESTLENLSELASQAEPIPWSRVYELQERPIWSHRTHTEAGMECVMCHGDVSESDELAEVTAVRSMASCISCHESHNASTTCITCHAWPPDPYKSDD